MSWQLWVLLGFGIYLFIGIILLIILKVKIDPNWKKLDSAFFATFWGLIVGWYWFDVIIRRIKKI